MGRWAKRLCKPGQPYVHVGFDVDETVQLLFGRMEAQLWSKPLNCQSQKARSLMCAFAQYLLPIGRFACCTSAMQSSCSAAFATACS